VTDDLAPFRGRYMPGLESLVLRGMVDLKPWDWQFLLEALGKGHARSLTRLDVSHGNETIGSDRLKRYISASNCPDLLLDGGVVL
jgi:hypothetical protein